MRWTTACLSAAAALTVAIFATPGFAAKNRGTAGSTDRADWCGSKLGECKAAADETCNFTYGGNASQLEGCLSERRNTCEHTYGSSSDCLTAARAIVQPFRNGTLKLQKK